MDINCRVLLLTVSLVFANVASLQADLLATDTALGIGDLPGDQTIRTLVGTLTLGANTVQGTHVLDSAGGQGDTFTVILPAGLMLVINSLTITNANLNAANGTSVHARFFQPIPPSGAFLSVFAEQLFAGNGTYDLSPVSNFANGGPQELWYSLQYGNLATGDLNPSYDWTWEIQTAASVPEPATIGLLSGALMLLASARGRSLRRR